MSVPQCRRVVLVALDGLRPDAIDVFSLPNLLALEGAGASTRRAQTVAPSVTAAAMGSLLTGATPEVHGLTSDRFRIPHPRGPVHPMPAVLRDAGLPTSAFLAQPPLLFRRLAHLLARRLGVHDPHFVGQGAGQIANAARQALGAQESGLIVFHFPDADRAGHLHGWMSPEYGDAARHLDATTGLVRSLALYGNVDETLMIVCADHGGGGAVFNDHDSAHRLDRTIPIILAGHGVHAGSSLAPASILDIPATILGALGVGAPPSYVGRELTEAFAEAALI